MLNIQSAAGGARSFTIYAPNIIVPGDYKFSNSIVDITDHKHVLGDGATSDRVAIQEVIDYAQPKNIPIGIPPAPNSIFGYAVDKAPDGNWCLLLDGRSHVYGMGAAASRIRPLSTVAFGVSTIVLSAAVGEAQFTDGWIMRDLFLGDISNGRRYGLHGLYIDTRAAGAQLSSPRISGLWVCQSYMTEIAGVGYGHGIFHENNQAASGQANGGMYNAEIHNCRNIGGGIRLLQSGDSNRIHYNIISGENNVAGAGLRCIGLYIDLCTSDGGGGSCTLYGNNITSKGGWLNITNAVHPIVVNNYGEIFGADAGLPYTGAGVPSGRALGLIYGAGGSPIVDGYIVGNRFDPQGGTSALVTAGLYVQNARGLVIRDNRLTPSTATMYGVVLDLDTFQNTVSSQSYTTSTPAAYYVLDKGTGNKVETSEALTLTAGFTNVGGVYPTAWAARNELGEVEVQFTLTCPANPNGLSPFTLPVNFRPTTNHRLPIQADTGSAALAAYLDIVASTGVATLVVSNTATRISGNIRFKNTLTAHRVRVP